MDPVDVDVSVEEDEEEESDPNWFPFKEKRRGMCRNLSERIEMTKLVR